jgi:succinate dehydrogenase / fumarate reductase cytochrome b subunit
VNDVIDKRPVNLSIPSIHFPVTAIVSILHRISGLLLILAFGAFLYALHFSLASPQDFDKVVAALQRTSCKIGIWVLLSALAYHSCAGIRHLLMDLGVGETLKGGVLGARIALVCSVVLIVVTFFWVMSW